LVDKPAAAAALEGVALSLLLVPQAAAISDTATNGSTNQPDDRTIIGLLGLLGVDGRRAGVAARMEPRVAAERGSD
jgi:hypothetical protein